MPPRKGKLMKTLQRARIIGKKALRYRRIRKREKKEKIRFEELPKGIQEEIQNLKKIRGLRGLSAGASAAALPIGVIALFKAEKGAVIATTSLATALFGAELADMANLGAKELTDSVARLVHNHRLRNEKIGKMLAKNKYFYIDIKGNIVGTNRLPRIRTGKREIEVGRRRNPSNQARPRHGRFMKPQRPKGAA